MRIVHVVVAILFLGIATTALRAEDVVTLTSGRDGSSRTRATGVIVDWTGEELTLRLPSGRENTYPTSRVVDIQSQWTAEQKQADQLFVEGKFNEASVLYRRAFDADPRVWAKRRILSQIVWCSQAAGDTERACVEFLRLVASDPTTQYFDAIPLAWKPQQPTLSLEGRAKTWMSGDDGSVAALIGASWLLSTSARTSAIDTLQRLENDRDARIAHLAGAQLWRTQIVTAKAEEVADWQRQIELMPQSLRGGAYFTLGRALSRLKQHEKAALAFMRVPILYSSDRQLSADALNAAARELEELDRPSEAAGLYREVIVDYAGTAIAAEAKSRLDAISIEKPRSQ